MEKGWYSLLHKTRCKSQQLLIALRPWQIAYPKTLFPHQLSTIINPYYARAR